MTHLRRLCALPLALALVLTPAAALAHDELSGTDPEDGATVEADSLDELTLTFSGAIAEVGAAMTVTDPEGASVVEGEPAVDGSGVTQGLAEDLTDGDYAVAWRVTSEDGHPISGEFSFTVTGAAEEEAEPAPAPSEEAPEDNAEGGAEDAAEEPAEQDSAPAASEEETSAQETAEDAAEDDSGAIVSTSGEATGLPLWAWLFVAVSAAGLLALLAATWRRGQR